MSTYIPADLIDELTEDYVGWCEECVALRNAYERWAHGPVAERERAFAAYLVALEREEYASAVYANRLYEIEHKKHERVAPRFIPGDLVSSRVSGSAEMMPG